MENLIFCAVKELMQIFRIKSLITPFARSYNIYGIELTISL